MIGVAIFFLLIGAMAAINITHNRNLNKRAKQMDKFFKNLNKIEPGFRSTKSYINPSGLGMIAVDTNSRKIALASTMDGPKYNVFYNVIGFDELINVEALLDGEPMQPTHTTARASGHIYSSDGKPVAQGTMSELVYYVPDVNTVVLKVLTNNIETPSIDVIFYQQKDDGADRGASQFAANDWLDTLMVIIRRNQSTQTVAGTNPTPLTPGF